MALLLGDLEEQTYNKPSSQKIVWTPGLVQKFETAKVDAKNMDSLYIPKPDDLTSDYCKYGINGTLWAKVDDKFHVVAHMSAKLEKSQQNLLPCDGEATAHYVAAKCANFSLPIKASNLRTISLLNNKPVVDASKLLKRGKFSSSKIVNFVLTSISDQNLDFYRISGKMGQNFVDDFGSRNPAQCTEENKENCKVCNFIKDCSELTMGSLSFIAKYDAQ
jgi:hypothetical protein